MVKPTIRLATRKSPLAVIQTEKVMVHIAPAFPDAELVMCKMSTTGDEQLQWSLENKGGKGLFTSELERALVQGEADLAVHSAKDLPTDIPDELILAGFLPRESSQDVLVLRKGCCQPPAKLATASPRRRCQMARYFPQVEWTEIRGNVQTRLEKIASGGIADGSVMALAGLKRLGLTSWPGLVFLPLPVAVSVPAAGQGAIAVQCRKSELERYQHLFCAETALAVNIERHVLAALGGGCHSAAAAHWGNQQLHVYEESRGFLRIPFTPQGDDWQLQIDQALTEYLS